MSSTPIVDLSQTDQRSFQAEDFNCGPVIFTGRTAETLKLHGKGREPWAGVKIDSGFRCEPTNNPVQRAIELVANPNNGHKGFERMVIDGAQGWNIGKAGSDSVFIYGDNCAGLEVVNCLVGYTGDIERSQDHGLLYAKPNRSNGRGGCTGVVMRGNLVAECRDFASIRADAQVDLCVGLGLWNGLDTYGKSSDDPGDPINLTRSALLDVVRCGQRSRFDADRCRISGCAFTAGDSRPIVDQTAVLWAEDTGAPDFQESNRQRGFPYFWYHKNDNNVPATTSHDLPVTVADDLDWVTIRSTWPNMNTTHGIPQAVVDILTAYGILHNGEPAEPFPPIDPPEVPPTEPEPPAEWWERLKALEGQTDANTARLDHYRLTEGAEDE